MPILYASYYGIGFDSIRAGQNAVVSTSTSTRDADYGDRSSYRSSADVVQGIDLGAGLPYDEIWMHYNQYNGDGSSDWDNELFSIFGPTYARAGSVTGGQFNVATAVFSVKAVNGSIDGYINNGSDVQTAMGLPTPGLPTGSVMTEVDFHFIFGGSNAYFELFYDGTRVMEGSGAFDRNGTEPGMRYVNFGQGAPIATYQTEFIVSTESTIGYKVNSHAFASDGDTNTFDVGTAADVAVNSDTRLANAPVDLGIGSGTANQQLLHAATALRTTPLNSALLDVKAHCVNGRFRKQSAGPAQVNASVKSGGTIYHASDTSAPNLGYTAFRGIWETDPATGSPWTKSAIGLAQGGVRSRA